MIVTQFQCCQGCSLRQPTSSESRPLSLPVKVTPASQPSWASSEERVKEIIAHVWDAVKQLTLQGQWMARCGVKKGGPWRTG
ncbi:hypothetical protein GN956_G26188 [Arapaima gigas]